MFAGELFTDSADKHDSDMLKDNILGFACFRKVLAAKYLQPFFKAWELRLWRTKLTKAAWCCFS